MSSKTKKARYVINMNTGAWGFRTEMTDRLPLTFRLIDDETCKALVDGRITSKQVIEAVKKEIMGKSDFSWEEFDRQRQAEKLKLNISQHDMVPIGEEAQKEEITDAPENVVKLSDIVGSNADASQTDQKLAAAADDANAGIVNGDDNFLPIGGNSEPAAVGRKRGAK